MTKRDFFRIVLRLFALYLLLLTVFTFIPSNISYQLYEFSVWPLLFILGSSVLMFALFFFLLRKSDVIIDVLKLDKGFDDEQINFGSLSSLEILKIGLIFIGGFLVLDNLPQFLNYCYLAFQLEVSPDGPNIMEMFGLSGNTHNFQWFLSGLNMLLGYLILTNLSRISNYLLKFKGKKDEYLD